MKGTVIEHLEEKEENQKAGVLAASCKKFNVGNQSGAECIRWQWKEEALSAKVTLKPKTRRTRSQVWGSTGVWFRCRILQG